MTVTRGSTIDDFSEAMDCIYRGEKYSVRDNGAVFRHAPVGRKARSFDNQWSFGKRSEKRGYMEIASVPVHRIVATAFHGEPPTEGHVVDHIDTNRRNNRRENLRWVTRLENVLLNPITVKRIEAVCGSVEAFLADPEKFRDRFQDPNFGWMREVSKEECWYSLERMLAWAKNDKLTSGGSLDEWIYNRDVLRNWYEEQVPEVAEVIQAKTPNAVQVNWRIPSEFPCCPLQYGEEPIRAYAGNLKAGSVFCRNDVYSSVVSKFELSDDGGSVYVISESTEGESAVRPWALATITFENGLFVHRSVQSFFTQKDAEKQYCLAQGLEWLGGDTFDDYC